MGTMLVPVAKFVEPQVALIALITGIIITVAVPLLQPVYVFIFL